MSKSVAFLIALALVATAPAHADESPWRLGAAVGYGERSNPLVLSADLPIAVDLDVAWFGKRFFFDNGDLGYTFVNNDAATFNAVARVKSDRVFFGRTEGAVVLFDFAGLPLASAVLVEVPDRDYAGEAGFELLTDGRWGFLQASAFHDVTGTHEGYELDLNYGVGFRRGRFYFEPGLGVAYKSKDLNNYYWGVRPQEANSVLPAYEAGAGINVRARVRMSYFFSKQWSFTLSAEYERLNNEAADSPIVAESEVIGWFGGMRYRF